MPSRLRRRAALLAGAAALLITPAAAQAAQPAVNLGGAPSDARLDAAMATGAKQVRIFAPWADLEPNGAGTYATKPGESSGTFDHIIQKLNAGGAQPIFVVINTPKWANGSGDPYEPPTKASDFGDFFGAFAAHNTSVGTVAAYEIWNEPDEAFFWHGGVDAGKYTAMLQAAYRSSRGKTTVPVLTGATTGNNYDWIEKLYGAGAQGSFDGVGVHTDTACLVAGPGETYRNTATDGRIGQFAFLGYREVRATMLAHGDDKPIWMTELGWSSTNGGPSSCERGAGTNMKPSGVSEATQAKYLTQAFQCLANDPYVASAGWFTLYNDTAGIDEVRNYGLLTAGGAKKPSYSAFQSVAAANGGAAGPCGDTSGPQITVKSPTEGQQFEDTLDLVASVTDDDTDLGRLSFQVDGSDKNIASFVPSNGLVKDKPIGLTPWYGSRQLSVGPHKITVVALDAKGNLSQQTVNVVKVKAGTGAKTVATSFKLPPKVTCKSGVCRLTGRLTPVKGQPNPSGKVLVEWQFKNRKGKFVKLTGGAKTAAKTFRFKLKPKLKGLWRVRVTYKGVAPYKDVSSKYLQFRVR